jgi:hypothetical protein
MADAPSWKVQTKENLKFLFETLKENHPQGKNRLLRLGRAYGISLDKVKFVEDENQFRFATIDFVSILGSDCTQVVSTDDACLLDTEERLFTAELPHGNLSLVIHNSCEKN